MAQHAFSYGEVKALALNMMWRQFKMHLALNSFKTHPKWLYKMILVSLKFYQTSMTPLHIQIGIR